MSEDKLIQNEKNAQQFFKGQNAGKKSDLEIPRAQFVEELRDQLHSLHLNKISDKRSAMDKFISNLSLKQILIGLGTFALLVVLTLAVTGNLTKSKDSGKKSESNLTEDKEEGNDIQKLSEVEESDIEKYFADDSEIQILAIKGDSEVLVKEESKYYLVKTDSQSEDRVKEIIIDQIDKAEFTVWNKTLDTEYSDMRAELASLFMDLNDEEVPVEEDKDQPEAPIVEGSQIVITEVVPGPGAVKIFWSIPEGLDTAAGFKIVYGNSPEVTFENGTSKYIADPGAFYGAVGMGSGTNIDTNSYYFRVCRYIASSNGCDSYSNAVAAAALPVE